MSDVTQLLDRIRSGDTAAADDLLPLVYQQLRQLARSKMAGEAAGQTLQATALVHEAYLRLEGEAQNDSNWENRGHFYAAAAEAIRRILVENARRKQRLKRGGHFDRQELNEIPVFEGEFREDLLALDDALTRLAEEDPVAAKLVHLRYFIGLSIPDSASMLGVSPRTGDRIWAYARAWLRKEMEE